MYILFKIVSMSWLISILGFINFFSIKNEKIPFAKKIKENWLYNFLSTGYILFIK